jgi:hypothetical protein
MDIPGSDKFQVSNYEIQMTSLLCCPDCFRNPIEEVSATAKSLKRKTYICKPVVEKWEAGYIFEIIL